MSDLIRLYLNFLTDVYQSVVEPYTNYKSLIKIYLQAYSTGAGPD